MAQLALGSPASRSTGAEQLWIVSPRFDLTWIFGGALLSCSMAATAIVFPATVVILWWAYTIFADGPHMMAAYTRTYFDPAARAKRPLLLWGSLGLLAIGPFMLVASHISGNRDLFLLFLAVATTYGYHHLVRQHYGFLALYKSKARDRSKLGFFLDKWCLYIGCWAPWIYYLLAHPRARSAIGLSEAPPLVPGLLIAVWAACIALFLAHGLRDENRSWPKLTYTTLAMLVHGLAYVLVGRFEPVYAESAGPDQDFLVITVMLSVFHNVQYIALVYMHNRSRYAERGGPARWASRSALRFVLVCFAFSLFYLPFSSATGVFPVLATLTGVTIGAISLNEIMLALWWGLALHHYVLDQRIWRIKDDPELRQHLGLSGSRA